MESSTLLDYANIPTTTSGTFTAYRTRSHSFYSKLTMLQYIRIIFQQRENPLTPRLLRFICPSFSVASTLAKIAVTLVGTFLLKSAHLGSLYILFADYLCVVAWYWWLFQQSTAGRAKLRCISCHLSAMALLLLVFAVLDRTGHHHHLGVVLAVNSVSQIGGSLVISN
ncbi:hypothetical protein N7530_008778 [Penicillium desertorum]|uniref:Uncharacterized protein n=1 Tax=Penicillium desertorum TaxID=1303715 RepID=A0A9W9WPQ4_9EURO|nr:hypothetical protein N7530_008778 [Penicillium desertorum]